MPKNILNLLIFVLDTLLKVIIDKWTENDITQQCVIQKMSSYLQIRCQV